MDSKNEIITDIGKHIRNCLNCKNHAEILPVLRELLKGRTKWSLSSEMNTAFVDAIESIKDCSYLDEFTQSLFALELLQIFIRDLRNFNEDELNRNLAYGIKPISAEAFL